MSDTEYSESIDGVQDESEENDGDGEGDADADADADADGYSSNNSSQHSTDSSEISSINSSSTDTDDGSDSCINEDATELAKLDKSIFVLPKPLCENSNIFHEFLSLETWQELPTAMQNDLQKFLPQFSYLEPQMAAVEQARTISMLFKRELKRFDGESPLEKLQSNLEKGNYRPDIAKLRQMINKSKRREQRFQYYERITHLAKQLFLSRQRQLESSYQSSPDEVVKVVRKTLPHSRASILSTDNKLWSARAHKRYYSELTEIARKFGCNNAEELSANEDEEDPHIIREQKSKIGEKQKATTAAITPGAAEVTEATDPNESPKTTVTSTNNISERCIYSTLFKRHHIFDDEIACRLQQQARYEKLCKYNFRQCLREHKRRKLTEPTLPEFETSDIRLRDVCSRAQMGGSFRRILGRKPKANNPPSTATTDPSKALQLNEEPPALVPIQSIKKLSLESDHNPSNHIMNISAHTDMDLCLGGSSLLAEDHESFNVLDGDVELQQVEVETLANNCNFALPKEIVLSSQGQLVLEPNDKSKPSNLPKLEPITKLGHTTKPVVEQQPVILANCTNSELIQETHACYFSLIRDFFCSTLDHRMRYDELRNKIDIWLRNPITALNEWYPLADKWSTLLRSAINFLVGDFPDLPEEYVPYIEFKNHLNIYQWIGAGRDSDNRLIELCSIWLEQRLKETKRPSILTSNYKSLSLADNDDSIGGYEGISGSSLIPPPPLPRCPTNWTVRPATAAETAEFQRQERQRFEQPHKAFTYRMYGYESVVAPVKGIYTPLLALSKARGHSMMVVDRPNFVTILTLVRDATARLPNGEGTRADISELLKSSQYINREAAENVLQTIVSGALDRMHTEPDPCVRYDAKRKIWIYLHRNRSEADFELLHQQNQNTKTKKSTQRKSKNLNKTDGSINHISPTPPTLNTTTKAAASSSSSSLISIPALIPTSPVIATNTNNNIKQKHHQTSKCPPVPPLKYNLPSTGGPQQQQQQQHQQQQQQKSLLKSVASKQENKFHVKQLQTANIPPQPSSTQARNTPLLTANAVTTPILVATPQGLQTVHVANANPQAMMQQSLDDGQITPMAGTASLAGKLVSLNKPIIINQHQLPPLAVTSKNPNQKPVKTTTTTLLQQHQQHQQHQQQQQQQQSITVSKTLMMNHVIAGADQMQASSSSSQLVEKLTKQAPPVSIPNLTNKNTIRLLPTTAVKTLISSSPTLVTANHLSPVNKERVIGAITVNVNQQQQQQQQQQQTQQQTQQPQQHIQAAKNFQHQANNTISIPISKAPSVAAVTNLLSPQAIKHHLTSSMVVGGQQQQQQQQQQHQQQQILLKNTQITSTGQKTQLGLILGNTTLLATKNPTGNNPTVNKVPRINATNLTPQQQRILLQNLKQQQQSQQSQQPQQSQQQQPLQQQHTQLLSNTPTNKPPVQFKTIQIMANGGTNTATASGNKATVLVSQDRTIASNLARFINTKVDNNTANGSGSGSSNTGNNSSSGGGGISGTRVITSSSGQIISLESLLQQNQGDLQRIIKAPAKPNILQQKYNNLKQQQQQITITSIPQIAANAKTIPAAATITTTPSPTLTTIKPPPSTSNANIKTTLSSNLTQPTTTSAAASGNILTTNTGGKIFTRNLTTAGNIRVINASGQLSNLNLVNLQGKPVVLTTTNNKPLLSTVKTQNTLQNTNFVIGGQTIKLQTNPNSINQNTQVSGRNLLPVATAAALTSPANTVSSTTSNSSGMQTVIMGNQILRLQQMPHILTTSTTSSRLITNNTTTANSVNITPNIAANNNNSSNNNNNNNNNASNLTKTIYIGSVSASAAAQAAAAAAKVATTALTTATTTAPTLQKNFIINTSNTAAAAVTNTIPTNARIIAGPGSVASSNPTAGNRLVFALQGGNQIFLSNFQNSNLGSLKTLQNMKFISLATNTTKTNTINITKNTGGATTVAVAATPTPTPTPSTSTTVNQNSN